MKLQFKLLLLSLIFVMCSNILLAESSLYTNAISVLPSSIAQIHFKKFKQLDVEKLIGKATLVEKNKHYYEMDGFKYSLEITYNRDVVSELSYTFVRNKPVLINLKFKIDTSKLVPYPNAGPAAGRYFLLSDSGVEMIIDPLSKTIYSIRLK